MTSSAKPSGAYPGCSFPICRPGAYTESSYRANSDDFPASARKAARRRRHHHPQPRDHHPRLPGDARRSARSPPAPLACRAPTEISGSVRRREIGILFTLSTVSICSIEDVAAATTAPFWFQLYVRK